MLTGWLKSSLTVLTSDLGGCVWISSQSVVVDLASFCVMVVFERIEVKRFRQAFKDTLDEPHMKNKELANRVSYSVQLVTVNHCVCTNVAWHNDANYPIFTVSSSQLSSANPGLQLPM